MLTRQQIQRLAQRNRIGQQAQERDYLQHLILFLLYTRGQEFIFKGGTALRLAYRGNRYSEDLDFNAPSFDAVMIEAEWRAVAEALADFGIIAELRNLWQSNVGFSADLSFRGPLFDGRDRTKSKVRLDANLRSETVDSHPLLLTSEYDDVRPFVANVITLDHLFAEKVRALIVRGKPRDLYDLWLMLGQGVTPDIHLIQRKLDLYEQAWSFDLFDDSIKAVESDWERDMRPLLTQFILFDIAQQVVQEAFRQASA